jgi:type 1 glutamine amidotransferase
MSKRALIVWGGWDGHEPDRVAELFAGILRLEGFEVEVRDTLAAFDDAERVRGFHLIVPVWTMGSIEPRREASVLAAVRAGAGIAGCHGGMCDSFRQNTEWQFMTGGQWVAHPGNDGVRYRVEICRDNPHPVTAGLPDFDVVSEQYYMHTDPGNNVLAVTRFPAPGVDGPHAGNPCLMPQVWTKTYGQGRVFYTALGHQRAVLEPETPREIMRRGLLWAAGLL